MHFAQVRSVGRPNRYGKQQVTLEYRDHVPGFPMFDTIKFVPEGRKGESATIAKISDAEYFDSEPPVVAAVTAVRSSQSSEDCAAAAASAVVTTSSQSSAASSQNSIVSTQFPADSQPAVDSSEYKCAGEAWLPRYKCRVPDLFEDFCALDLLRCQVPDHMKARWAQLCEGFIVGNLFATTTSSNVALRNVELALLGPLCHTTQYNDVQAKSHTKDVQPLGLVEVFEQLKIQGACHK